MSAWNARYFLQKRAARWIRLLGFMVALALAVQAHAQPTIQATPQTGTVSATWSGITSPSGTDWIGLYAPGSANIAFIEWIYVSCSKSPGSARAAGTCSLPLSASLPSGSYELRLLANNGFNTLAVSSVFKLGSSTQVALTTSPADVVPGATLTATWTNIPGASARDWLGLYQPNSSDTAFIDWFYVSCSKAATNPRPSGSCSYQLPANLPPGPYNMRMFSNDAFIKLATANTFLVSVSNSSNVANVQRFLEQATFGPTPSLTAAVQASGIEAYINQQLNAPMRDYPNLEFWPTSRPSTCVDTCQRDNYTYYQVQKHFFTNALAGEDQLRQRVAFGLSQILVTSQVDVPYPAWMRSYQQLLYRSAFGNFRQLLYDVTLHPTMGRFLDMLNSQCQRSNPINVNVCRSGGLSQPNENYGREVLQLFSMGTFVLNDDGTRRLNNGNPIPTYDQKIIEEFSRVFTGWILAPALPSADPNAAAGSTVPNYRDPMVQRLDSQNREAYHDRGAKVLLGGVTLPAERTASQDLNDAIDNIAYHPNVAPYMSKLLIQQLVTSNPSSQYVARIVAVWRANQTSASQLFQVVKAILLDAEARGNSKDAATSPNYGKLREPILFETAILRALNAASDGILNSVGGGIGTADMGEDLFNAASVFNYFPPTARVAGENAVGPEFAILSSLSALRRANFVNQLVYSSIAPAPPNRPLGTSVDLTVFNSLAANPDQLIDALNNLLLHGSMSAEMRGNIQTAVAALPASNAIGRVRSAVYLILTSSQFQVQR